MKHKKAIILLNMGAPNNLDEVELFLKNMFNDPNIITVKSSLLRKFISYMIVASRKEEAKKNYKQIGGKSPLIDNTKKLIEKILQLESSIYVDFAMRYTPPFSKEVIDKLINLDIKEVFLFPLYPHYSTTTTKSSLEDFFNTAKELNLKANIKYIKNFYQDIRYNQAIINSIKNTIKEIDPNSCDLIFSAHSLPQKIVKNGDPYQKEIEENVKILKKMLKEQKINFNKIHLAYQSKLGPVKWLEPSLEDSLKNIANKKVVIYPISFLLDNSETLQELHIEYKEVAKSLGYEDYIVCRCLNDSQEFAEIILSLALDTPPLSSHQLSF